MQWLVRGAAPNDSLFFHCTSSSSFAVKILLMLLTAALDSGHGGQTKDSDGDEGDGYDEGGHMSILVVFANKYWDTVIYPVCKLACPGHMFLILDIGGL